MVDRVPVEKKKAANEDESAVEIPPLLAQHPIFLGDISAATVRAVSAQARFQSLAERSVLYRARTHSALYLLCTGSVATFQHSADGESFESYFLRGSGALGVAEMLQQRSLMEETGMYETAVVMERAEVFVVPSAVMLALATVSAPLLFNLSTLLSARQAQAFLNERSLLDSSLVRVARHLALRCRREGREVTAGSYVIRCTQDDVAASTGLNSRTVARAMRTLHECGRLYPRRGEYLVIEPDTLVVAASHV